MKIALFTDTFLPQINGVVTATLNLAKGLANKGHKIYIISPKYKDFEEFKYKNIEVKRVSAIPAFFYEDFKFVSPINFAIKKFIKKEGIEIIHFQTPITLGLQAIFIAKSLKLPLVGTFHTFFADPQYLKHVKLNNPLIQKLAWKYSNFYYNSCDLVTCPSQNTKKELILNGCHKKIEVISNGIDFNIFDNSNYKKFKKKYNLIGRNLLFIGRMAHEKNIFYLLDCFKLVIKSVPDVKLLMVGDGPQFEEIKNKIKSLELEDKVILLGRISHENLVKSGIFKALDIFTTTSITENQPITLLEAQANGLVCIGINKKGIPDLIQNNKDGFLIELDDKKGFADAIIKLVKNEKMYNKMRKLTLKNIKKHELSSVIKVWEEVYINLIN